MHFFLRIKSWQLFMLMFVLPSFVALVSTELIYFSYVMFLIMWLGWVWSVAKGIYDLEALDLTNSKFFLIIAKLETFQWVMVYVLIYSVISPFHSEGIFEGKLAAMIPHTLALFCLLYMVFFVAEVFAVYQKKIGAKLINGSFGSFMMFYFYPIGLWFLQPKINKIFAKELP